MTNIPGVLAWGVRTRALSYVPNVKKCIAMTVKVRELRVRGVVLKEALVAILQR